MTGGFKMLKRVLIILVSCITILYGTLVQAEIQDWQPDSDEWNQDKDWYIVRRVKDFFSELFKKLHGAVQSVIDFFRDIWEFLKKQVDDIVTLLGDTWQWLKDEVEEWYMWIGDQIWRTCEWLWDALMSIWDKAVEWLFWVGETLFNFLIDFLDWMIGVVISFVEWLIEQIPEIELPNGFDDGMNFMLEMGTALNGIFPVKETLAWLVLYITIVLTVAVYRIIKSFIPFIST